MMFRNIGERSDGIAIATAMDSLLMLARRVYFRTSWALHRASGVSIISGEPVRRAAQVREPTAPRHQARSYKNEKQEFYEPHPHIHVEDAAYMPALFCMELIWSRRIRVNIAWGAMRT